jgi:hypothetical protein
MSTIDATTLQPVDLAPMLRAWSSGLYPSEAAVGLLIAYGRWLRRRDFLARLVDTVDDGWGPARHRPADGHDRLRGRIGFHRPSARLVQRAHRPATGRLARRRPAPGRGAARAVPRGPVMADAASNVETARQELLCRLLIERFGPVPSRRRRTQPGSRPGEHRLPTPASTAPSALDERGVR